jgi:hypothetical protein
MFAWLQICRCIFGISHLCIYSLLISFWTLSIVQISTNQKTQRFGNRSSFRNVAFSGLWKSGRWTKTRSLVVMSVTHHHQNPLDCIYAFTVVSFLWIEEGLCSWAEVPSIWQQCLLHIFQCVCSEGEILVDSTLHRGQHLSRKQHTSRSQIVHNIIIHSNATIQDDSDTSEVRISTLWQKWNSGSTRVIISGVSLTFQWECDITINDYNYHNPGHYLSPYHLLKDATFWRLASVSVFRRNLHRWAQ